MRIIVILLALLIIGLLVYQQLGGPPNRSIEPAADEAASGMPRVPQRPQDLPAFEQQMQQFMNDSAEERRQRLDALEQ